MKRRLRPWPVVLLGVACLIAGSARGTAAQSLHLAELFAEQGRLDDAMAEVMAWFEIRGAEATPQELQHGLWLRGRFAENPAEGMRDLDELATRFPEGPFTDRALTWMAAYAADQADEARARELYLRIVTDFPESSGAGEARSWLLGRGVPVPEAEPEVPPAAPATVVDADTLPTVTDPVARAAEGAASDTVAARATPADSTSLAAEPVAVDTAAAPPTGADPLAAASEAVADTVTAEATRADSTAPATESTADTLAVEPAEATTPTPAVVRPERVDSAATPSETPVDTVRTEEVAAEPPPPPVERIPHGPPVPGAAQGGRWAVQIGAFRNPDGAAGLVDEMVAAGLDARLVQVPLNDLLRVRVGRFAGSDEASAELERVRAAGYDGAVVSDARDETVVRR